jgi:hypothetical protein
MAGRYYRKGGFLSVEFLNNLSRPMPKKTTASAAVEQIDTMIRTIRGTRVMLDRDLAQIYGVPTKVVQPSCETQRRSLSGRVYVSTHQRRSRSSSGFKVTKL